MIRTTFLTSAILAGLTGAAIAGGGCDWSKGTTAGDFTPAPVADAAETTHDPMLLPTGDAATKTDEG